MKIFFTKLYSIVVKCISLLALSDGYLTSWLLTNKIDSSSLTEFIRSYKKIKLIFLVIFVLICIFFGGYVIDYVKTVSSILNMERLYLRNYVVLVFLICSFILHLELKSLSVLFTFLFLKKKLLKIKNTLILLIFLACTSMIVIAIIFCEFAINNELEERQNDFAELRKIQSNLALNNQEINLYVDRVPLLYRRAGFNVRYKIDYFDGLGLDNSRVLIIANPNDMHQFLLINNYQFRKMSDKMSIYVKDPEIIKLLESKMLYFSEYYYDKNLDLKRIAQINRLKYDINKGIVISPKRKNIAQTDLMQLIKGKYQFTFDIISDDKMYSDVDVASIELSSNSGSVLLYNSVLNSSELLNHSSKFQFSIEVDNNYNSAVLLLKNLSESNLYIKEIGIEKLK